MFSESPVAGQGGWGLGCGTCCCGAASACVVPLGSEVNQGHLQPAELVWATFVISRPLGGWFYLLIPP